MKEFDQNTETSGSAIARLWQRLPIVIQAILLGFFVNTIGVGAWVTILNIVPSPWSMIAAIGMLWLFWKYFSGSWRPRSTAETRRISFRAIKLSPNVWKWSLLAALLFVVIFQSGLVVTFRIIEFPAEAFTLEYNFDEMPLWAAWVVIIIASLVAGICEETGFRGYMQVPLEKRYGPVVGITIVSIVFLLAHLHQAWAGPVLFHIVAVSVLLGIIAYTSGSLLPGIFAHTIVDIFNFSYWWSNIAGKFEQRPIAETGIDLNFILWVLICAVSLALFFWAISKVSAARQQT